MTKYRHEYNRPGVGGLLIALILAAVIATLYSVAVIAEGPVYEKGQGLTHTTSCTPTTHRAPDPDGNQATITLEELKNGEVALYEGGSIFEAGTPVSGPHTTDIYCGHVWNIDDFPSGQYYVFGWEYDTEDRKSAISVEGGPFSSSWPTMPPAAPVMAQ